MYTGTSLRVIQKGIHWYYYILIVASESLKLFFLHQEKNRLTGEYYPEYLDFNRPHCLNHLVVDNKYLPYWKGIESF